MSFCAECKAEMMENAAREGCCAASHLYGFLCFFAKLGPRGIALSTESEETLRYLVGRFFDYGIELPEDAVKSGKKIHTLRIEQPRSCERILTDFGFADGEPQLHIDRGFFLCDDCPKAFVTGAFLAAGTLTEPSKGYHLEFSTHRARLAADLAALLAEQGFQPKLSQRGYEQVVYFKDSSQIEDLLAYMSAPDSAMRLMEAKIYKDVRNQVTRRVNCESANVGKAVAAAGEDIARIEALFAAGGSSELTGDLLDMAKLRTDNPDLSLAELAELIGGGITKSGVSHRLRRIREIAREYLDEHGN